MPIEVDSQPYPGDGGGHEGDKRERTPMVYKKCRYERSGDACSLYAYHANSCANVLLKVCKSQEWEHNNQAM